MPSQVSGSAGSSANGAIVSAILLTNGRPAPGIVTSDVVTNGSFTLKGLAAGSYLLKIELSASQLTKLSGSDVSNVLSNPIITVDGVSNYSI